MRNEHSCRSDREKRNRLYSCSLSLFRRIFTSSTYFTNAAVSFIVFIFRCELLRLLRATRRYNNCLFFFFLSLIPLETNKGKEKIKHAHLTTIPFKQWLENSSKISTKHSRTLRVFSNFARFVREMLGFCVRICGNVARCREKFADFTSRVPCFFDASDSLRKNSLVFARSWN